MSELFDEERLQEKVLRICETKNVILEHLYHKPLIDPAELLRTMKEYREMIKPYVCDVSAYLDRALKEGKTILLEGQLGTLKDPDHGIYPMVTSSSTLAAFGAIGAGLPPHEIREIITVCKAYSSAVGAGAFVSEILVRKRMSFGAEAVMAESLARPQGVRVVWDGLTVWLLSTGAGCKAPRMWRLPCWMYWGIWMRFPCASGTKWTAK